MKQNMHKISNSKRGAVNWRVLTILGLILIGGIAWWGLSGGTGGSGSEALAMDGDVKYHRVERGPLTVSLLAPGTTEAKKTTSIICQVQDSNVEIVWVIDEGTIVQPGDKLMELEVDGLEEEIMDQKVEVETEYSEYLSAVEQMEIQKSQNVTNLLVAENKYDLAQLDLNKYLEGDYPQAIRNAEAEIQLAEAELKRAEDRVRWTRRLVEEGYVSQDELVADELSLERRKIDLDRAQKERELLEKFEYKRQVSSLKTSVEEARQDLDRTKLSNERELRERQIRVDTQQARVEMEKLQLRMREERLENTEIYAPQSGMVVYARDTGRRGQEDIIEPGSQVRFRQKLLELPDFSSWEIETRVHESLIRRVKLNQPALIKIDALPEHTLTGYVRKVGVLPEQADWFMPDVKEYSVRLDITTTTLPLKPGMTAKVEIVLNKLEDVLQVPIDSIRQIDGTTFVWRKGEAGPEPTAVETGEYNDTHIQIVSGLREGDIILEEPPLSASVPKTILQRPSDGKELPEPDRPIEDAPQRDQMMPGQGNFGPGNSQGGRPGGAASDVTSGDGNASNMSSQQDSENEKAGA